MQHLIHISGTFQRYVYSTGKPETIVIKTDKGEFFAPSSEFKMGNKR